MGLGGWWERSQGKERVAGLAVHTRNEPAFWVFWSEGDVRDSLWGLVE